MKKLLFLSMTMLMAILSLGLTSCGDDNDEPTDKTDIVGTWKLSGKEDGFTYTSLIQFTKNGKFYNVEIAEEDGDMEVEVIRGIYSVSNGVITITEKDEDDRNIETYSVKYQVKNKQLIISEGAYSITYNQAKDSEIEKYL